MSQPLIAGTDSFENIGMQMTGRAPHLMRRSRLKPMPKCPYFATCVPRLSRGMSALQVTVGTINVSLAR